jgi:hypothetical protein
MHMGGSTFNNIRREIAALYTTIWSNSHIYSSNVVFSTTISAIPMKNLCLLEKFLHFIQQFGQIRTSRALKLYLVQQYLRFL